MPKLYDRNSVSTIRENPQNNVSQVVNPAQNFEMRAVEQLGETVSRIGSELMVRKDRMDAVKAESDFAIAMINTEKDLQNDPDYSTYSNRYAENIQKQQTEALKNIQNPTIKKQLESRFALDIARGQARVSELALRKSNDALRADTIETMSRNREAALTVTDESRRAALINNTMTAIQNAQDSGAYSAEQAQSLRQQFPVDYALGAVDMLSPSEQLSALENTKGTIYDFIPSDQKAELIRRAKTKLDQDKSLVQMSVMEKHRDAQAAYLTGKSYEAPTLGEYTLAFGEAKGSALYKDMQSAKDLGKDISYATTASAEDLQELLNSKNPQNSAAEAGYADNLEQYGKLQKAISSIVKERETDPATYLQKYNPSIKFAFEQAQGGENVTDYINAVKAEKERLGIQSSKVVPDSYAQGVASQVSAAPGEEMVDMIESLSNQWGKHWPQVYSQMSKTLTPAALVIGSGIDKPTATLIANHANIKTDELKKGLEKSDVTDAGRAMTEVLSEFQATTSAQGPGGVATFSKLYDQAQRLAYIYMGQGQSVSSSVDKAFRSLVDDKYKLVGSYRVPREYDADKVATGLNPILETVDFTKFTAYAPEGTPKDFVAERIKSAASRNGQWVTNEDETGLVLTINGDALIDDEGNRVEFTFDELIGASTGKLSESHNKALMNIK